MNKVLKTVKQAEMSGKVTGVSVDGKSCVSKKLVNDRLETISRTEVLVVIVYSSERFLCSIDLVNKSGKAQAKALFDALIDSGI